MGGDSHYLSNLRDVHFNLFEMLGVDSYLGMGPFSSFDPEQARSVLSEFESFCASSAWAGSFKAADVEPLALSAQGDVRLPEALVSSLKAYYDASWHLLGVPEGLGGVPAPAAIRWAAAEFALGANATAALWPIGPLMAGIVAKVGTEGQVQAFAKPMVAKLWGATMVLTEPDAGSDVGAGRTGASFVAANASPAAGHKEGHDMGSIYHLSGIKRFITSADATPLHENTVHLVLARPQGALGGTKGLSLFLVPKFMVSADGELVVDASGPVRNGVRVSGLENKMGIKGSATCELSLGQDGTPCVGYLLGDVHAGIRQMFLVIEYARMMVGTKAMATLSTGYLNALSYAKLRVQGRRLSASTQDGPVEIVRHPDVRRMLVSQKAHAEGMRALVLFTGWVQDQATLCSSASIVQFDGETESDFSARCRKIWLAREDLLLPLVKGYCSEKAYELLGSQTLQTFGGSGYTADYPIEQYVRDAKIDTLYEGTTGIQALDLLFRKIVKDEGSSLSWLLGEISAASASARETLPFICDRFDEALASFQLHLGAVLSHVAASLSETDRSRIDLAALHTTSLLMSLAELTVGYLLLRQAAIASAHLASGRASGPDIFFYEGKLAAARWFATEVLPHLDARAKAAEREDGSVMCLSLESL